MARRKSVSDMPENGLASILERSPLLDRRELTRSSTAFTFTSTASTSRSVSAYKPRGYKPHSKTRSAPQQSSRAEALPLKAITERQTVNSAPGLQRTRSAPFHRYSSSPQYTPSYRSSPAFSSSPAFRSSPQYRVNPVVRFDERLFPERMNYGIAGYNTSRPRNFPAVREGKRSLVQRRPRSLQIWKLWKRRFRERMTRIRVSSACSRMMMKFRRRH